MGVITMNFNIGPRMMKTGIAVALAILTTDFFKLELGMVAVLTAVVAMQPSIMRSISYLKETAISTALGVGSALIGAYTFGLHPVSIGITVMLAIAINIKFGWVKTVNITIITISVIMLAGEDTLNFSLLVERLSLILIGILSAFLVNMLIFPPNHQKLIYAMLKKASEKTTFLLRYIPSKNMKVKELHAKEDEIKDIIKELNDYIRVIDDEKDRMFIRKRISFMRDIIVFKQMLKVIELEYQLIHNLEQKIDKLEEISDNQTFLVKKLVEKLVDYHENIILTYEGKVLPQVGMEKDSFTAMNLTINDLLNELEQSEVDRWMDIFPVANSIVALMVELEQFEKYTKRQVQTF